MEKKYIKEAITMLEESGNTSLFLNTVGNKYNKKTKKVVKKSDIDIFNSIADASKLAIFNVDETTFNFVKGE